VVYTSEYKLNCNFIFFWLRFLGFRCARTTHALTALQVARMPQGLSIQGFKSQNRRYLMILMVNTTQDENNG
jgi:hypothetical protein